MADLFVGGDVDPASHQRTDRLVNLPSGDLTTHGVIVGMTGSGKTGLGVVLIEDGAAAGVPVAADRPEGRPHQPVPDVPRRSPRPTSSRGSTPATPRAPASRVPDFAADQAAAWTEGLAGWGLERADDRRAARRPPSSRSTRRGRAAGSGSTSSARSSAPADTERRRDGRRRDRRLRRRPARPRRHRRRPADQPRAHPALQPDPQRVERRAQPRPADAGRHGADTRRSASSACSTSTSSSRRRTAPRSPCGSTACSPRRRSPRG